MLLSLTVFFRFLYQTKFQISTSESLKHQLSETVLWLEDTQIVEQLISSVPQTILIGHIVSFLELLISSDKPIPIEKKGLRRNPFKNDI